MNQYPVGQVVKCPFYFASRELTNTEYATFVAGGGLPTGVGIDPVSVLFRYKLDNGPPTSTTPTKDAVGLYHATITVSAPGDYEWQGYAQDGSANAVAAMWPQHFEGVAF